MMLENQCNQPKGKKRLFDEDSEEDEEAVELPQRKEAPPKSNLVK
jgi:hypothetical protein